MTDSMKTIGSKAIRPSRVPAYMAMLLGAIFTILLVPAYGQQEVDPTWYDPWAGPNTAAPNTAAVHPSQPAAVVHSPHSAQPLAAAHRYQPTAKSVPPAPEAGKRRGKDAEFRQSRHDAAHQGRGTPSADNRLPGVACLAGFEDFRSPDDPITG